MDDFHKFVEMTGRFPSEIPGQQPLGIHWLWWIYPELYEKTFKKKLPPLPKEWKINLKEDKTMGEMRTMGKEGDVKVVWDADKTDEVANAEKMFNDLIKKNYLAFRVKKDGSQGDKITSFDKYAEKLIMVPMQKGG